MIVKAGDKYPIEFRANMNLTGATVRMIARRPGCAAEDLPAEVTDAAEGLVSHTLTGDLPIGTYELELEVTTAGQVVTFPNSGYATLIVQKDLG